jgi:hypothetical protein
VVSKELVPANTIEAYSSNLSNKLQFAKMLLNTQMCPQGFKTPEQVIAAIFYGQEIGFSPLQSLQSINVIQGRPTLDAAGIKAKILEAGGTFKTIKWTDEECTLECTRGEWADKFTFTLKDAEKMGLLSKDNWKRMPKQMLYARCVSTLGRNMYADVLRGFYGKEEMEDAVINVTPAPQPVIEPVQEPGEPFIYHIPEISREQRIFLEKRGASLVHDLFWYVASDLGPKLKKYLVTSEEQANKIRALHAKAKELQESLGDAAQVEVGEVEG